MGVARIVLAGSLYFAIVFAAGFALGAIRVILLQPYWGASAARVAELPVMIVVSYLAARFVTRRLGPGDRGTWLSVGAFAFLLLMVAEMMLGLLLFRTPPAALFGDLITPIGALSFLAQALLILFPALAAGWDRTAA